MRLSTIALLTVLLAFMHTTVQAEGLQVGGGAHYWKAVDDIDVGDIDEDGIGWYLSLRGSPAALAHVELDVEWLPDAIFGVDEQIVAPQISLLLGSAIYVGVGIGTYYVDGEFAEDPFYTLRAGLDLELLPSVHVDINGNYRFDNFDEIDQAVKNVDTDTVTIGVAIRIDV